LNASVSKGTLCAFFCIEIIAPYFILSKAFFSIIGASKAINLLLTQKTRVKVVILQGGDSLMALKKNPATLYERVNAYDGHSS